MTISRTNYCTNPSATSITGFAVSAGTSGTSSGAVVSSGGLYGPSFYRETWSVASTGGSPGIQYQENVSGASGDVRSASLWVRASVPRNISLLLRFRTGTTNVTNGQGPTVAVPANTWTQIKCENIVATGGYDNIFMWVLPVSPGFTFQPADTLDIDGVLLVSTSYAGGFFDGSTATATNKTYAWTGTANASKSTESISLPTTTVQAMVDAPCPRVGVTVDGLGAGSTVYNLWRTSDGKRSVVRGARNRTTVDSDYVIDYEAPLGRPVTYDVEVVTGTNYLAATFPDTATVTSSTWWIQDPLVPSSAIPLAVNHQDTTIPTLTAAAVKALAYAADINIIPILGSSQPVALMGTRQVASGVDFSMFTRAATATTTLRNLIQQTPLLLVRTNGVRNDGVPGLAYFASAKPVEVPVTVAFGGTLTNWQLQGDLVAAPSLNVLVPIWTYGTVAALWATYQQAQTTLAAKTYLDVLKSPSGV